MGLATLYKKTNTGAIQYWKIYVVEKLDSCVIKTEYGQLNTSSPQETRDIISKGKNLGRANATTFIEQSHAEAKSKWEKQKKKGYVESIDAAKSDQTDKLIEGGVNPMLAYSYDEHSGKITWPCYGQPKLDGHRCIAIVSNGECQLWSRTRKRIYSVPHIAEALAKRFHDQQLVFDGELYNHDCKDDFERISSIARKQKPDKDHKLVQYHIYDLVSTEKFSRRSARLEELLGQAQDPIIPVFTKLLSNEEHMLKVMDVFLKDGYEGLIVRNCSAPYQHRRSYNLQKVKKMHDADYKIVDVCEGRGKLIGHVGAFICEDKRGQQFKAKMSGETKKLKEYFEKPKLWRGKLLTVQFQELTGKNGVPRFPVGLRIREDI